jgi:PKD repeat protein
LTGRNRNMRKILLIFSLLVVLVSDVFSAPPPRQIEIMLQDSASGLASLAQVQFAPGSSPLFFAAEDHAFVLQSPDSFPQLYSFTQDNVACGLNVYGMFNQTRVIRLGFAVSNAGSFTFSLQQFTNFDPASMLFLEDRQLNTFTDLRHGTYKVSVSAVGEINNRFFLHITLPPSLASSPAGCLNNDGIVMVQEDSSIIWNACKLIDSSNNVISIDTNVTGNFSFTGLAGGNYRVEFDYSVYTPQQSIFVDEHQLVSGLNVSNNHDHVLQNIQFYTAASNATQINWDFGDGSTITGVANPTYFYIYPGVYTAKVNCSNNFGCVVESDTVMYIDAGTSVSNIDGNTVKIFTDVSAIRIEVDNPAGEDYNYAVYNLDGQIVKSGPVSASGMYVDMKNQASGIYVVGIRSTTSSMSQKVLVTN